MFYLIKFSLNKSSAGGSLLIISQLGLSTAATKLCNVQFQPQIYKEVLGVLPGFVASNCV